MPAQDFVDLLLHLVEITRRRCICNNVGLASTGGPEVVWILVLRQQYCDGPMEGRQLALDFCSGVTHAAKSNTGFVCRR